MLKLFRIDSNDGGDKLSASDNEMLYQMYYQQHCINTYNTHLGLSPRHQVSIPHLPDGMNLWCLDLANPQVAGSRYAPLSQDSLKWIIMKNGHCFIWIYHNIIWLNIHADCAMHWKMTESCKTNRLYCMQSEFQYHHTIRQQLMLYVDWSRFE